MKAKKDVLYDNYETFILDFEGHVIEAGIDAMLANPLFEDQFEGNDGKNINMEKLKRELLKFRDSFTKINKIMQNCKPTDNERN